MLLVPPTSMVSPDLAGNRHGRIDRLRCPVRSGADALTVEGTRWKLLSRSLSLSPLSDNRKHNTQQSPDPTLCGQNFSSALLAS